MLSYGSADAKASAASSAGAEEGTSAHHLPRLHVLRAASTADNSSSPHHLLSYPTLTPLSAAASTTDREKDANVLTSASKTTTSSSALTLEPRTRSASALTRAALASPLISSNHEDHELSSHRDRRPSSSSSGISGRVAEVPSSDQMVRDEGWFRCDGTKSECQMTLGSSFIDPMLAIGQSLSRAPSFNSLPNSFLWPVIQFSPHTTATHPQTQTYSASCLLRRSLFTHSHTFS